MAIKLIIAGSRHFNDYEFVKREILRVMAERDSKSFFPETIHSIISGGARGTDKLGEKFAKEKCIPVAIFSARWDKEGKAAGPLRNIEMANYADVLIAFWDGVSRGTEHMIDTMLARKKEVHVVKIPMRTNDNY